MSSSNLGPLVLLATRIRKERQIITFTQKAAVVEWAEATLTGERERVVRLEPGIALGENA